MKLMASGVTFSAAMQRSPSFSRSSSSTRITIRPARISSIASAMVESAGSRVRLGVGAEAAGPLDRRAGVGMMGFESSVRTDECGSGGRVGRLPGGGRSDDKIVAWSVNHTRRRLGCRVRSRASASRARARVGAGGSCCRTPFRKSSSETLNLAEKSCRSSRPRYRHAHQLAKGLEDALAPGRDGGKGRRVAPLLLDLGERLHVRHVALVELHDLRELRRSRCRWP